MPLPPAPRHHQPPVPSASFLSRIASYPADLVWLAAEEWAAVDVGELLKGVRYPLAALLNALFIACCMYRMRPTCDCEDPLGLEGGKVVHGVSTVGTDLVFYGLWGLAVGNALLLAVGCHKTRFFHNALKDLPIRSPNVRRKSLHRPSSHDRPQMDEETNQGRSLLAAMWKTVDNMRRQAERPAIPTAMNEVEGYEIAVWDPPEFAVTVFCFFSPAHLLTLSLMSASTWPFHLLVAALLSLQTHHTVSLYSQRTLDECIVRDQVFNEYNAKFVYPRINIQKRDAATMTVAVGSGPETQGTVHGTPVHNNAGYSSWGRGSAMGSSSRATEGWSKMQEGPMPQ
ncbi:hypothetical protein HDU93_002362 [Gonapodya sp. JEL0774]|nr:hypothetical protein HDU93_002362 [Gonapodya sp. JEL0774]